MGLALLGAELVDEGEDVTVILSKKLAKIRRSASPHVLLSDHARIEELLIGLLIEVVTVGDDDKRPVAGPLTQDLLGKKSIETVFPDPCVCQNTPSLPRSSGGACCSSSIRASALLTPRYWWLRASSLTKPLGRSWNTTKFSMRSRRRSLVHMPRMTVSSETDPSSPSELIFFHSEKNSQPDVIVPTLVSAPFDRTMNPLGVNKCGMESR